MITVAGPDWKTTRQLAAALREVPENGRFVFGVRGLSNIEQLRRFSSNGVPCPEFTHLVEQAYDWVIERQTVYARKNEHTKGRDIVIAGSLGPTFGIPETGMYRRGLVIPELWYQRDYWTKLVPNILEEWRVHIFDEKSIARGRKHNVAANPGDLVRNRNSGYRMEHVSDPPKGLRPVAKAAVEACGYEYGAVDILRTADGFSVLEVNSAPAMDNYTLEKYVTAIRQKFAQS